MSNARTTWLVAAWMVIATTAPATAVQVMVRKLDGSQVVGELRAISVEQLELANPVSEAPPQMFVELRETMAVEFPQQRPTEERGLPSVVVLADGSQLSFEQVAIDKQQALIRLPNGIAGQSANEWILAAAEIQAIRYGRDRQHAAEWRRLAASVGSTDLIVVYRKRGTAVDAVECIVEQVGANAVRVLLDGEPIDVPQAKIYGLVFAQLDQPKLPAETIVVEAAGDLRIAASQVSFEVPGALHLSTMNNQALTLPIEKIERIDFSAGRVRWLGDLKLIEQAWRPRFGFPDGLPLVARPPGLLFDRSFAGEPLRIVGVGEQGSPDAATEFTHGVAMRGGSEVEFAVPAGFHWFYATAGIDPLTLVEGAVTLQVYADDRLASEHVINGSSPADIRTPLQGASRLRVVVGFGANLDLGDRLHLGDARVTR